MRSFNIMQVKALARFKNKQLLKGGRGDVLVCSLVKNIEDSIKTNCEECGIDCYYIDRYEDNKDLLKKNHKKICTECALKNKDLDPEVRKILDRTKENKHL
ncbi:hypothetical protein HYV89_01265 [Candidatus Woesearchaeota archaeon]|nr:hypothetical protein [Candidatus Woesearchaeota archaeon]